MRLILLTLVLASTAMYSAQARASAALDECRSAIKSAAENLKPKIYEPPKAPPACAPIDPTCGVLQQKFAEQMKAAGPSGKLTPQSAADQESIRKCALLAQERCDAYAAGVASGLTSSDAWRRAMYGCSNSLSELGGSYFTCVCTHGGQKPALPDPAQTLRLPEHNTKKPDRPLN